MAHKLRGVVRATGEGALAGYGTGAAIVGGVGAATARTLRIDFISLTHWICSTDMSDEPSDAARIFEKFSTIAPTKRLSAMKLPTSSHARK